MILIGSWDAIDLPLLFFFSKTKLKPQFFSCTAPSPSKQGVTRIVTRALCYPNTVFFSPKTEHLLHGREGPRKIPRRHYESNLCLFGSRLTLLAWCQVPGVNTPDTCERSATPKCINLPNKFSRPGTAKGSSRNQSSPSYRVKFFVPFSRRISSSVFPVVFEGRRVGESTTAVLQLGPPRITWKIGWSQGCVRKDDTGPGRNDDTAPNPHSQTSISIYHPRFQSGSVPMNL